MDRLQSNERARVEQIERRMKARLEQGDLLKDLVNNFTSEFNRGKQGIIRQLEKIKTLEESELSAAFDALVPRVSDLQVRLNEAVIFLPGFELRVARETLQQVEAQIAKTRRAVFPNSRFRFSAAAKATLSPAADAAHQTTTVTATQHQDDVDLQNDVEEGIGDGDASFADQENAVLTYDAEGQTTGPVILTDYTLARLSHCVVSLCAPASSMRIHRLTGCRVYCAPVAGSVHIEECEDCVFVLASKQVRMHTSTRCDLYLHIKSGPIIEHCSAVRFAPYIFQYEQLADHLKAAKLEFGPEASKWNDVQDFRWLRAQKSPNWEVLPDAQRVSQCLPVLTAIDRERDEALWTAAATAESAALVPVVQTATGEKQAKPVPQQQPGQPSGDADDESGEEEEEWEM